MKPLEARFWFNPSSDTWGSEINDDDFLLEAGIDRPEGEMLVVSSHHTTRLGEYFSEVSVDSALVQPDTAAALVRALQTVEEPLRYGLPHEESRTDLELDEKPYRMLSWLSMTSSSSGIDKDDPFRNEIETMRLLPGRASRRVLRESRKKDASVVWETVKNESVYMYEQWSDTPPNTESNNFSDKVRSDGERLWISEERFKET